MNKDNVLEVYKGNKKNPKHGKELNVSVDKAIDFLLTKQLNYGEFKTEIRDQHGSSADHQLTEEWVFDSSPFVTTLVLNSLSLILSDKRVQQIREKGIKFLREQVEDYGLWRYWSSYNEKHNLLPPDLDDTCCISQFLRLNNIEFPGNREIILGNKNSVGLFYTWVLSTPEKSELYFNGRWKSAVNQEQDICCVVNANTVLYLGDDKECFEAIQYLAEVFCSGPEKFYSPYYNHATSFYYALSRIIYDRHSPLDSIKKDLIEQILSLQKHDGSFGDELKTALAVCSLLNCGFKDDALVSAIDFLIQNQQSDGSWRRIPWYGYHSDKATYGSAELTTGFCLEALVRYKASKLYYSPSSNRVYFLFRLIRSQDWWLYKIPPLLAIAYAEILLLDLLASQSILTISTLLFAIICVAAYGHIINDSFDVEVDQQVGKHNSMAQFSPWQRALFCLAFAGLGFSLPILLDFGTLAISLLGINYLLPTLYSAPPFRFKEKGILGILSDAAGAHAVPTLFIATTFAHLVAAPSLPTAALAISATAWAFCAGLRGILLHQLWDRSDDLKSSVKTFVTESQVETVRFWMSRLLFPVEMLLLSSLILVISPAAPLVLVFTVFYFLLKLTLTKLDPTATLDPAPVQKAYVIPHDFYEAGLPLILATILALKSPWFIILLLLHVVLFYPGFERRITNLIQFIRNLSARPPLNLSQSDSALINAPLQPTQDRSVTHAQTLAESESAPASDNSLHPNPEISPTPDQTQPAQILTEPQLTSSQLEQLQDYLKQFHDQLRRLQSNTARDRHQTETELANLQVALNQTQAKFTNLRSEFAQAEAVRQAAQTEATQLKRFLHSQGAEVVMDYYRQAIATDPDNLQLYNQAIALHPHDAQLHLQLASRLIQQGKHHEAISRYQTAIQHCPNHFDLHLALAKTLETAKRWEEAIATYRHAIALNPQSAIVHEYLGNALAAHGQLNEASTAYRRSLQLQS